MRVRGGAGVGESGPGDDLGGGVVPVEVTKVDAGSGLGEAMGPATGFVGAILSTGATKR